MVLGTNKNDYFVLNMDQNKIKSLTEIALLAIKIDQKLKLKSLSEQLCKKACCKLHTFGRIRKCLIFEKV